MNIAFRSNYIDMAWTLLSLACFIHQCLHLVMTTMACTPSQWCQTYNQLHGYSVKTKPSLRKPNSWPAEHCQMLKTFIRNLRNTMFSNKISNALDTNNYL